MPETDAAMGKLAEMIADLNGYVERRAGEIAAVRIEAAEDAASDRVAALVAEANEKLGECQALRQLSEDVATELRRRIRCAERNRDRAAAIIERIMTMHADCGCWVCSAGRVAGLRPREQYRDPGREYAVVRVEENRNGD